MGIRRENDTVDNLHTLAMVYFSASALVVSKYPDSPVKRSSNKLAAGRRVVKIHNCADVVSVNCLGSVHLSHIESVTVGVFAADCEVYGFDWIESQTGAFIVQSHFLNGRLPSQIVKDDRSVDASCADDIGVRRIIPHPEYRIDIPLKFVNGLGTLIGPHLHNLASSHKLRLAWGVVNIANH